MKTTATYVELSLLPLDVGFDLRVTKTKVNLPNKQRIRMKYMNRDCECDTEASVTGLKKILRACGYTIA